MEDQLRQIANALEGNGISADGFTAFERIAHALEGDDPKEATSLDCIAHALESIAKSMDPNFQRLQLLHADFTHSIDKLCEQLKDSARKE